MAESREGTCVAVSEKTVAGSCFGSPTRIKRLHPYFRGMRVDTSTACGSEMCYFHKIMAIKEGGAGAVSGASRRDRGRISAAHLGGASRRDLACAASSMSTVSNPCLSAENIE